MGGRILDQQPIQHLGRAGALEGILARLVLVVQVSPHRHPPLHTRYIAAGHRPAQPFIEPVVQCGGRWVQQAALPFSQLARLRGHLGVAAGQAAQAAKPIQRCHGRGGAGAGAVQKRSAPLGRSSSLATGRPHSWASASKASQH